MNKHTPGPWKTSNDGCDIEAIYGPNKEDVLGICSMYADESSEANAALIAAAPELLEALNNLCNVLSDDGNDYRYSQLFNTVMAARNRARNAIAKAEGKIMFKSDWTIEELEAKLREKNSIIRALKAVSEERLEIIERLQRDGYEEGKCS
jgi:hypothetical protein